MLIVFPSCRGFLRQDLYHLAVAAVARKQTRQTGLGDRFRTRQPRLILSGKGEGTKRALKGARRQEIGAQAEAAILDGVAAHQFFQPGLAGVVEAPEGFPVGWTTAGDEEGAAPLALAQQGIQAAQEAPVSGQVYSQRIFPDLRLEVADGREAAEVSGGTNQQIDGAVAFMKGRSQRVDGIELTEVERYEKRFETAGAGDLVIELFQAANGAGDEYAARALLRDLARQRPSQTPGRPGDDGDLPLEATPPTMPCASFLRHPYVPRRSAPCSRTGSLAAVPAGSSLEGVGARILTGSHNFSCSES